MVLGPITLMEKLMGFLSNIGKIGISIGGAFANAIERIANKQEFEAVMAAVVLVAAADGTVSPAEQAAAVGLIKTHPAFGGYNSADVDRAFKEGAGLIGMDREYGGEALYDKIRAVSDSAARAKIATIAFQIAAADGNVDDSEKKVIDKIRSL